MTYSVSKNSVTMKSDWGLFKVTENGAVISQHASRPAAVISSIVFDFDNVFAAITEIFLAVVDQSNRCTPITVVSSFIHSFTINQST